MNTSEPHQEDIFPDSSTGQWQGQAIRTQGHGNQELKGTRAEFLAQIVHAVNPVLSISLMIRKKFTKSH